MHFPELSEGGPLVLNKIHTMPSLYFDDLMNMYGMNNKIKNSAVSVTFIDQPIKM